MGVNVESRAERHPSLNPEWIGEPAENTAGPIFESFTSFTLRYCGEELEWRLSALSSVRVTMIPGPQKENHLYSRYNVQKRFQKT